MDEKQVDRVTSMIEKLSKSVEGSLDKGISRLITSLGGKLDRYTSSTEQEQKKQGDEQKKDAKADAASLLRSSIENGMKLKSAVTKGLIGMEQRVYKVFDDGRAEAKAFYLRMDERVKNGFKELKDMMKGTVKGIIETFTGPFYGLISKLSGVIGPTLGKIFNAPIGVMMAASKGMKSWFAKKFDFDIAGKLEKKVTGIFTNLTSAMGTSVFNKLPFMFKMFQPPEIPKPREFTNEERILGAVEESSDTMRGVEDWVRTSSFTQTGIHDLLSQSVNNQKRIEDAIYFATDHISDSVDKLSAKPAAFEKGRRAERVSGMAKGGIVGTAGIAMLHPAEVVTPSSIFDKQFDYYDFFKEQALNINDYLKKILGVEKEQKGGGLLDNLSGGPGGFMGKLKQFAFGKWGNAAAGGAGLLAGGVETYKTLKPSQEKYGTGLGTANAVARGMISGSLSFIGARLFGATGAAIGGIVGDKIGSISNTIGEKLGTGLFDAKELIGSKMSAAGDKLSAMGDSIASKFSDAKDYVTDTFTKVGAGFKSGIDTFKKSIMSYFPSGESISDTLKSVLSGLMSLGPVVVKYAVDTAKKGADAARETVKQAKEVGSRGVDSVKRAFNIGGSRWKAETKGMNPEVMKAFNAAALDYKAQTGKTATLTEGVRTREQQAMLGKGNKYMTAKPGMSVHEQGFALDVNSADAREMERLGILAKHGLTRPYGERDPVHMELAKLATAQKRAEIRSGKIPAATVASTSPKPRLKAAADGAFTRTAGFAELHPAEIVSPIGKFTEMLSKTAMGMAAPVMGGMGDESTKYLAAIVAGINKLVETGTAKPLSPREVKATPVPDFPGDPGTIYGGNYFPQKGRQWG